VLAGCVSAPQQRFAPGEAPVVLGPAVRDNVTPMEAVLACYADHIAATRRPPIVIGVGDVKDYTGKYSINEGNAITQGGALMVYSALGKLGGAVSIAERFDPVIAERELAYADRRQLGDGRNHQVGGPNGGQNVPWLPYFGGTINKSDYFIVGGITELNYNINSGGAEFAVNQVGVKARTFSQSVSVDLRIVDTKSLMVVRTVSLTKQFNGYEVGLNVFRFFGSKLYDVDIGAKGQEPVQMGVRAALEEGVVRLMAAVTQVDHRPCMTMRPGSGEQIPLVPAAELRKVDNPGDATPGGAAAAPVAQNVVQGGVAVNATGAAARASRAGPRRWPSTSAPPRWAAARSRRSTRSPAPPGRARPTSCWWRATPRTGTPASATSSPTSALPPSPRHWPTAACRRAPSASRGGPTRPTRRSTATARACRRSPSCAWAARWWAPRPRRAALLRLPLHRLLPQRPHRLPPRPQTLPPGAAEHAGIPFSPSVSSHPGVTQ
jgi:curli biogenesis system outer membrane secretion channel CsgG